MNDLEILRGKFDVQTHADNFISYLEVIVRCDGTIEYAVPSHQQKLEAIAREIYGNEKFEQMLQTPESYDYLQWLCNITQCVSVWDNFCVKPLSYNKEQRASLKLLNESVYTRAPHIHLYSGGF